MSASDGMTFAPQGEAQAVCRQGQFIFAATRLDHGHIYGMCNGLIQAGATLKWAYDPDGKKVEALCRKYPGAKPARSEAEILDDPEIRLVAGAAIPSYRCALGLRVMEAGKDYFTDKAPMTTLQQLVEAREATRRTGRKYMVYYSERLHVEAAILAGYLIRDGAIGRVVQVIGTGPHRLDAAKRPDWFFKKDLYGGILCDIASHQFEQFLSFTGATDAKVQASKVANYHNKQYVELEDFGDATIIADNNATGYSRVDWLTPDGLRTWGDGRTFILGTAGYMELRKYIDVARDTGPDQLFLVNDKGEQSISAKGRTGFPFFGQLILDCLNRTDHAMTQAHAFKAAELCLEAQRQAVRVE